MNIMILISSTGLDPYRFKIFEDDDEELEYESDEDEYEEAEDDAEVKFVQKIYAYG